MATYPVPDALPADADTMAGSIQSRIKQRLIVDVLCNGQTGVFVLESRLFFRSDCLTANGDTGRKQVIPLAAYTECGALPHV
ncbi:hypothetical protein ACXPVS_02520 [Pseudomonas sp. Ma2-10]